MDSYLEIARRVLGEARQPLGASQILKIAYQLHMVPRDLYGRTQHKTLQARLSTDILRHRLRSEFYRTGPGRFSLRSMLADRAASARDVREYTAPLRAAQLGRFDVIAFPRAGLAGLGPIGSCHLSIDEAMALPWRYARMEDLRHDACLLPLRLFVVVIDDAPQVLSHRAVTPGSDFARRTALGLAGVVRREDRSLFSTDRSGLADAAVRTLMHRLDLPRRLLSALEDASRWSVPVTFYEQGAEPGPDDFVVAMTFRCSGIVDFVEAVDAQVSTEWLPLPVQTNDLGRFDRWSARFIADASLRFAVMGPDTLF